MNSTETVASTGTNGWAVASLVAGIVSVIFFWGGWLFVATSAAAIGSGVKGARVSGTGKGQRGVATAGLVLGVIASILEFFMLCSIGHP